MLGVYAQSYGGASWTGAAGTAMGAAEAQKALGLSDYSNLASLGATAGLMLPGDQAWWQMGAAHALQGPTFLYFQMDAVIQANGQTNQMSVMYSTDGSTNPAVAAATVTLGTGLNDGNYHEYWVQLQLAAPSGGWSVADMNNLRVFVQNTSNQGTATDQQFWVDAVRIVLRGTLLCGTPTPTPSPTPRATDTPTRTPSATRTLTSPAPGVGVYAYPQPASRTVHFALRLAKPATVDIQVLNSGGRPASTLSAHLGVGLGSLPLNLGGYAPGVYYYRVVLHYDDGSTAALAVATFVVAP
jgi:hypothetical protein